MSEQPSWEQLRSFVAVLEEGSLSAAARRLDTAQATVRRHVEALERQLTTRLFTRAANGLTPTAAALAALPHAQAIDAQIAALVRAITRAGALTGTVRLTSSEVIGGQVLPPLLAALRVKSPEIEIELAAVNTVKDLVRRDADIAVRMARPRQAALVARMIGTVEVGLFATAAYLADRPAPRAIGDLAHHQLVGGDRDPAVQRALAAIGVRNAAFAMRSDSDLVQLAAVRAGLGIGVCQLPIAVRDPDLVRVLPDLALSLPVWLAMHEDLRAVPRVRAVFDHLATGLTDYLTP